ncbi:uncharacterized protein LOC110841686 [Folsomia candida]|uniref:Uncharacterized protein n=1 Tax=Folsomia candida TaxID=158441 RepID=A0A226F113_FOLCA|nr:uncharacterized protein LOC110841686 [Folsomia candida]OXA63114.1 hypothetical protein Fcan01_03653 [Folsomia candida]
MGLFDGNTWVIPETFSFFSRICGILAMSCILMPEEQRSVPELVFVVSCAVVFFLNCFEFIGTPKENLMVQLLAVGVGILGTALLLLTADSLHNQRSAFYASIFSGISIFGSFVSGTDFYIHVLSTSSL